MCFNNSISSLLKKQTKKQAADWRSVGLMSCRLIWAFREHREPGSFCLSLSRPWKIHALQLPVFSLIYFRWSNAERKPQEQLQFYEYFLSLCSCQEESYQWTKERWTETISFKPRNHLVLLSSHANLLPHFLRDMQTRTPLVKISTGTWMDTETYAASAVSEISLTTCNPWL